MLGRFFDFARTYSFVAKTVEGHLFNAKVYQNGAVEILLVDGRKPTIFQQKYFASYSMNPIALSLRSAGGAPPVFRPSGMAVYPSTPAKPPRGAPRPLQGGMARSADTSASPLPTAPPADTGTPLWVWGAGAATLVGVAYLATRPTGKSSAGQAK
jgi:hypothetical protein